MEESSPFFGNPLKSFASSGLNFHSWSKYFRFGGSSSFFVGPFFDEGFSSSSNKSSEKEKIYSITFKEMGKRTAYQKTNLALQRGKLFGDKMMTLVDMLFRKKKHQH